MFDWLSTLVKYRSMKTHSRKHVVNVKTIGTEKWNTKYLILSWAIFSDLRKLMSRTRAMII